jgi:predicted amidohydrolase
MIEIAALQIASLSFDKTKLNYYLTIARAKKCKILVLGEYAINLFFKELEKMPKSFIKEQIKRQKDILKELAKIYNMTIVTPAIISEKDGFKKVIMRVSPNSTHTYEQQVLINYKHWNEEKFFANEIKPFTQPMIFVQDGVKIAVMFGFEIHFDKIWEEVMKKKVDVVIVPTASTFESKERWRDILRARAFINSCYVLRVNHIGTFADKKIQWVFYGDSFLVEPDGEIINYLGSKEELLIAKINPDVCKKTRRDWGFATAVSKRDKIEEESK